MEGKYQPEVEAAMRAFFDALPEHQPRQYAAVEAVKLGHGAVRYLARVLECDEKTIRRGKREMIEPRRTGRHAGERAPQPRQSRSLPVVI